MVNSKRPDNFVLGTMV